MAKIMIVDDSKTVVAMTGAALEDKGYTVVAAYSGTEALEAVKTEAPDLILLDVMLPGMNGFAVCRLLKFDDKYKHIPIIMLTSRAGDSDKESSEKVGADAYVTKTAGTEELLPKIEELLKKGTS